MRTILRHASVALVSVAAFSAPASAADLSGKHLILVSCGPSNPWCKTFNERITGILKETGVKITVLENDLDPVQVNQQMLQSALGQQ